MYNEIIISMLTLSAIFWPV